MKLKLLVTVAILFVGLALVLQGGLLEERYDVTRGDFRGFRIGMTRANALDRIRQMSPYLIQGIPSESFSPSKETMLKFGTFRLSEMDSASMKKLLSFDAWKFEIQSEPPVGSTYELYFTDDRLERIRYYRPRFQIK